MPRILVGLGGLLSDAACCVVKNGRLVSAVEQSKVSHWGRHSQFPDEAFSAALEAAEVEPAEIECVAIARPFAQGSESAAQLELRSRFPRSEIVVVEHHTAHAASAYYASNFDSATVLSVDRAGDFRSAVLFEGSGNRLTPVRELYFPDSLGDLFNRGGGARSALTLLERLKRPARKAGGRVTVLLGNHEVMTALGNEAYCTEEEYLSFASAAEKRAWPARVQRAARRLYRATSPSGHVLPFEPRLSTWKALHAPGRAELRRSLSANSKLGKALRSLPVAYQREHVVYVHACLLPQWAELGIDGLNRAAEAAWAQSRRRYLKLPKKSLFRSSDGPLWDRSLIERNRRAAAELTRSLRALGVRRMVIGHTQTKSVKGGQEGRILGLHQNRFRQIDAVHIGFAQIRGIQHGTFKCRGS